MTDLDNVDAFRTPTASQAAGMTLAAARGMIAAAESAARGMRVAMSIAVVDSGDQLVAFARMDGADLVTVGLARDKAFTALVNRMPTGDLGPLVQPGAEFYGYDSVAGGRMIVFAGGMPLDRGGVLVGAVAPAAEARTRTSGPPRRLSPPSVRRSLSAAPRAPGYRLRAGASPG